MIARVFVCAAIAEVVATLDTCDADDGSCEHDVTSALQTHASKQTSMVSSQISRVVRAIRSAPHDAETICVEAEAGDEAPAAGSFMQDGTATAVEQGFVASVSGQYCVPKQTLLLIQRANGFADGASFEQALGRKTPTWKNDDVFRGKRLPRKCSAIPPLCKMSVAPVSDKICPVLWTTHNSILKKLPGCLEGDYPDLPGVNARRNVEGACARTTQLEWTCPLECTDVMDYAKEQDANFKESYACWSPLEGTGACNNTVLANSVNTFLKAQMQDVKASVGGLGFIVDANEAYVCTEKSVDEICAPHCPLTCQTVFQEIMSISGETEQNLCQSEGCDDAATASFVNREVASNLQPIRDTFDMQVSASGEPCDAAAVKAICQTHCP